MKTNNVIQDKSFAFALRIVFLYDDLILEKHFALGNQILKSGTSIGANVEEAIGSISPKEFLSKITISYKEARESNYWLRLLKASKKMDDGLADSLISDVNELIRIIGSIQKTLKEKIRNS